MGPRSCAELSVDVGYDVVDVGDGLDGAGDGGVEVLGRGSRVRAGEGEVGPELVERDPGVEEFGLQAAEGVVFGFVGERVQVAGGVEGGLGAEAGRGEVAAVAADAWGRDPAVPVTGHGVGQRWRS